MIQRGSSLINLGESLGSLVKKQSNINIHEKKCLDNLDQTVGLWEINCRRQAGTVYYQPLITPGWGLDFPSAELASSRIGNLLDPDTIYDALYKELCKKRRLHFGTQQGINSVKLGK